MQLCRSLLTEQVKTEHLRIRYVFAVEVFNLLFQGHSQSQSCSKPFLQTEIGLYVDYGGHIFFRKFLVRASGGITNVKSALQKPEPSTLFSFHQLSLNFPL
jgi:hypothetical protein